MTFNIEKDIPIPEKTNWKQPKKYFFEQMSIGDSVFIPVHITKAAGRTTYAAKKYDMKFTARAEGNGARIWRIA